MAEIKQLKDPVSRRRFLAVGGSTTAVAAFLAACGDDSGTTTRPPTTMAGGASETAEFGKGDIGILNYALTLEYLETAFYADVVKSGLFKGADLETIRRFGQRGGRTRPGSDRGREAARRQAGAGTESRVPAEEREGGSGTGRRPSRTSAPRPTSARRRTSRALKSWPRRSPSTASRGGTLPSSTPCWANRSPRTAPSPSRPT